MRYISALIFSALFLIASPALAQRQSFLEADTISVDDATGDINAQGNVLVAFEDERVSGDQLVWIKSQQRILVTGNVVFTQKDGTKSYAMAMELDEAMQRWAITEIKSYLQNETTAEGRNATRTEPTRIELSGATYTACPECEDPDAEPCGSYARKPSSMMNKNRTSSTATRGWRCWVYRCFTHPICATPHLPSSAAVVS